MKITSDEGFDRTGRLLKERNNWIPLQIAGKLMTVRSDVKGTENEASEVLRNEKAVLAIMLV